METENGEKPVLYIKFKYQLLENKGEGALAERTFIRVYQEVLLITKQG